ncbi:hypothetical protein [Streptomyces sp. ALI-76-A]|jgi:hypothetical protein|uniref:hypothetical protein n=1 Tax=Streptomyces sp. ALI-76-A TaxID=3025736 RepID=UPI00256EAF53|nr:hypothetical protein [Streptomyces sp. ALI-76-A]MDL5199247.1 hypothetical protein [Streptomyces sp. ALI-76-A]
MTGDHDRHGDAHDRARSADEPGAHSGAERQAQERSIPGTASAKEGYQTDQGTVAGKPLEGVEKEDRAENERTAEAPEERGSGSGPTGA